MQTRQLQIEIPRSKEGLEFYEKFKDSRQDVYCYSGEITPYLFELFESLVRENKKSEKALLVLSTPGGDADAAFRVARHFKREYAEFDLCVMGVCKSAGTLLALGADKIAMGPLGEFGPLDVQLFQDDEFMNRNSGLSLAQALENINQASFEFWEESFLKIRKRSGGTITTSTAAEIAAKLSIGIYSPIAESIDPMRLGDMQRALDVATHYGCMLGAQPAIVNHLVNSYPSHSFVIDRTEAEKLFRGSLREVTEVEDLFIQQIAQASNDEFSLDATRKYGTTDVSYVVELELENENQKKSSESKSPAAKRSRKRAAKKSASRKDSK